MRQELERLLDTHRAQRPEMQPQDYYKLLYQREFGCGHTAPAPETAGRHLMEEYARAAGLPGADAVPEHVKGAALPGCVEDIGNGLCRIYLNGSWSRLFRRRAGRPGALGGRRAAATGRTDPAAADRDSARRRLPGRTPQRSVPGAICAPLPRGAPVLCRRLACSAAGPARFGIRFPRRPCAAGHRRALRQRKKHVSALFEFIGSPYRRSGDF